MFAFGILHNGTHGYSALQDKRSQLQKKHRKIWLTLHFNKTGHACTVHDPQLFLKRVATMVLNGVFCFKNLGYSTCTIHDPRNNKCRGDFSQNGTLDSRLHQWLIS